MLLINIDILELLNARKLLWLFMYFLFTYCINHKGFKLCESLQFASQECVLVWPTVGNEVWLLSDEVWLDRKTLFPKFIHFKGENMTGKMRERAHRSKTCTQAHYSGKREMS